jgi:hypothetical protein
MAMEASPAVKYPALKLGDAPMGGMILQVFS